MGGLGRVLAVVAVTACYDRPEAVAPTYSERTWVLREPVTFPPARGGARLAYDPVSAQVILYGGKTTTGFIQADMWTWDGTQWTEICEVCSPGPRRGHGMVYDSRRQRIVLFGGETATAGGSNDTWEWDGGEWQAMSPGGTVPLQRTQFYMAFDPYRGKTVLYGGTILGGTDEYAVYEYDGEIWTAVPGSEHPSTGHDIGSAATIDAFTGEMFLFGGEPALDELWSWDGTAWSPHCQACTGLPRSGASLVYDPPRHRFVIVGGYANGLEVAGTWESVGDTFVMVSETIPSARDSAGLVYDPRRDVIVLFGGNGDGCSEDCADTLEFVPLVE